MRRARLDGVGGAVLLGALGLLLAWAFGAAALNSPGPGRAGAARRGPALPDPRARSTTSCRPRARSSTCCATSTRRRGERARGEGAAPEPAIAARPRRPTRPATASSRCSAPPAGSGVEGSGWVAGPGLVVTNAHVVAGEDDTTVTTDRAGPLDATAVHYDPRNDLAMLRVAGLDLPPLPLAPDVPPRAPRARCSAIRRTGPSTVAPARLGSTGEVISQDSYGRGPDQRQMTPFRGEVRERQLRRPRGRRRRARC